jgi:hypothetical protein
MVQKDTSVPQGTIETLGFWFRTPLSDCQHWSIVPSGTDTSFKNANPVRQLPYTGLLSPGPYGTDFL